MKHTPGPWKVDAPKVPVGMNQENDRLVRGKDGEHICETFQYQNHDNPNGPSVANAHLIAAAPEMRSELIASTAYFQGLLQVGELTNSQRFHIEGIVENNQHQFQVPFIMGYN